MASPPVADMQSAAKQNGASGVTAPAFPASSPFPAAPASRARSAAPSAAVPWAGVVGGATRDWMAPQAADGFALRQASATGDMPRLRSLLSQPVAIDAVDALGRTALMLATLNGQAAAVEALLAHGANPNVADAQGRTPLGVAHATRQTAIAAALERAGAH